MSRNCLGFFLKNNLIEELEIWRTVISCTSRSSLRNGPKIKLLSEKIVLLTNWYESYLFGFFGEKQLIWHFFFLWKQLISELKSWRTVISCMLLKKGRKQRWTKMQLTCGSRFQIQDNLVSETRIKELKVRFEKCLILSDLKCER